MDRRDFLRDFLRASSAAVLGFGLPTDVFAQNAPRTDPQWDAGGLRHLLPQVSDSQILIKASFSTPMLDAPALRVGDLSVRGRMSDTRGEHWHFHAGGLQPGRRYTLSLATTDGRALAAPWDLAPFPGPDERPQRFRVPFFSCAGGHEALPVGPNKFLPTAVRNRLLRRALSFAPQAAVAQSSARAAIGDCAPQSAGTCWGRPAAPHGLRRRKRTGRGSVVGARRDQETAPGPRAPRVHARRWWRVKAYSVARAAAHRRGNANARRGCRSCARAR